MDTIYALSSGALPSGVAVVRTSGPQSRLVLETMIGGPVDPRRAVLRSIRDRNGESIDRGLVLWFPGPESFTGEDMAEYQIHGGRAVVAALFRCFETFAGMRPADPGEFTRRAFLAGRVDLTEAEGLADLLAAETEAQRRQAAGQAAGALRQLYGEWRRRLVRIRALIEADFDFAEEEDVPGSVATEAWADAAALREEIRHHLDGADRGERIRNGLQVVLLGAPNVGKSSLLNALACRDVAIVTEEAGTTRDIVEVHLDLGGRAVTLVDTAGLREGTGRVEAEGIRRALARGRSADVVLWLEAPDIGVAARPEEDISRGEVWSVATKCDLVDGEGPGRRVDGETKRFVVSATTGEGLDILVTALTRFADERGRGVNEVLPTRERHRRHLLDTIAQLNNGIEEVGKPAELRAEDLRRAGDELGRITGEIGVEELLDVIFGEFCIGK